MDVFDWPIPVTLSNVIVLRCLICQFRITWYKLLNENGQSNSSIVALHYIPYNHCGIKVCRQEIRLPPL